MPIQCGTHSTLDGHDNVIFAETTGKFYKILLQNLDIRAIMLRVSGQGARFQHWDVAKR